jgi:preprotein translocase subunit SecG
MTIDEEWVFLICFVVVVVIVVVLFQEGKTGLWQMGR